MSNLKANVDDDIDMSLVHLSLVHYHYL